MALAFDDRRLLVTVVHEASLEDVEQEFARFQKSDRRMRLFGRLRDYLTAVKQARCGSSVVIDGSFIMACVDEPEDIDLIVELPPDWDLAANLKPYQYNVLSRRRVKKEYGIDVFPVRPRSAEQQQWIAFFSQVNIKWCQQFGWPADSRKGTVRVVL